VVSSHDNSIVFLINCWVWKRYTLNINRSNHEYIEKEITATMYLNTLRLVSLLGVGYHYLKCVTSFRILFPRSVIVSEIMHHSDGQAEPPKLRRRFRNANWV
jgi:hypothetical protein